MNFTSLDSMKADESLIRKELELGGAQFKGRACCCIFCGDKHPSAGIFFHDGACLFKCQKCGFAGSFLDVRAKVNKRTPTEELRAMNDAAAGAPIPKKEPPPKLYPSIDYIKKAIPNIEDEYSDLYADPTTGAPTFTAIRWRRDGEGKKSFTQCFKVEGGWQMKKPENWGEYPIANRKAIAKADTVVFVEGEKSVRALASAGILATTTPGGAGKSGACDLSPLAGKRVILWPDNDEPEDAFPKGKGVAHMEQVRRFLEGLTPPATVSWIDPTGIELPAKGDAADFVERYAGWTVEEKKEVIQDVLDDAVLLGASADFRKRMDEVLSGKMRALPFGAWGLLSRLTKALMPGTVTMLCGDPGATKSFMLLEAAQLWMEMGIKWSLYQLEEDHFFHMKRALAQRVGDGRLTDHEWCENNSATVMEYQAKEAHWVDAFAPHMTEAPESDIDLGGLAEWIEGRAKLGYEIIVADPITAVDNGKDPWLGERKFLLRVKRAARKYGCRLVLVTHPTKGTVKRDFGSSKMAGSTNFARFTQTILWMERLDGDAEVYIRGRFGIPVAVTANRKVHLLKTRNSIGAGSVIAFHFDPKTLRFSELGEVQPEPES